MMELRHLALQAFYCPEPAAKVQAVTTLWNQAADGALDCAQILVAQAPVGRPERPLLVDPRTVPRRNAASAEGHAALVHAIVHIEFNAINLALDAVWRFAGLPPAYYHDWLRVAYEETQHFCLLHSHLQQQNVAYGDFEAHDGLWSLCAATAYDPAARMALVPRTLEARGLDATPLIQARLRAIGAPRALQAAALLDTILHDEIGHVATGNRWDHWLCQRDGLDPVAFYAEVAKRHKAPRPKPPLNQQARLHAGFSRLELELLSHP